MSQRANLVSRRAPKLHMGLYSKLRDNPRRVSTYGVASPTVTYVGFNFQSPPRRTSQPRVRNVDCNPFSILSPTHQDEAVRRSLRGPTPARQEKDFLGNDLVDLCYVAEPRLRAQSTGKSSSGNGSSPPKKRIELVVPTTYEPRITNLLKECASAKPSCPFNLQDSADATTAAKNSFNNLLRNTGASARSLTVKSSTNIGKTEKLEQEMTEEKTIKECYKTHIQEVLRRHHIDVDTDNNSINPESLKTFDVTSIKDKDSAKIEGRKSDTQLLLQNVKGQHIVINPQLTIVREEKRTKKHMFVDSMLDLRKERIKNIYEDVLSKAGKNSAKQLYRMYFPDSFRTIDVVRLDEEVEEKNRLKLQGGANIIYHAASRANKIARSQKTRRSPSPVEKQKRIKNYGRWYLKPEEYGMKMNVLCCAKK